MILKRLLALISRKTGFDIVTGPVRLSGLRAVVLNEVLVFRQGQTLLYVPQLTLRLNLRSLLHRTLEVTEIELHGAELTLAGSGSDSAPAKDPGKEEDAPSSRGLPRWLRLNKVIISESSARFALGGRVLLLSGIETEVAFSSPNPIECDIQLHAEELYGATRLLGPIDLPLRVRPEAITLAPATIGVGEDVLTMEGVLNRDPQLSFSVHLAAPALALSALSEAIGPGLSPLSRGKFEDFTLDLKGNAADKEELINTLQGNLAADFRNLYFSTELRATPPFSLLYLPIRAVTLVSQTVPLSVFPEKVRELFVAVNQRAAEGQSLHLQDGELRLTFRGEQIEISELVVGIDLLPKVHFSGTIERLETLDCMANIALLSSRIPLRISGTLRQPQLDLKTFAKSLAAQFGVSLARLPFNLASRTAGLFGRKANTAAAPATAAEEEEFEPQ